ncbi:MAG: YihY family inner membrane protein [Pseudomonadota bacterium]
MTTTKSRLAFWRGTSPRVIARDVWRFFRFVLRRFTVDRMSQTAGALTFSTLLALVPLLVIAFAVLAGFPAFDSFKDQLQEALFGALLPEVGAEIRTYLAEFTSGASNLTAAGVVGLAFTAVMLLSTVETTLNRIWQVDKPRPVLSRLLIFWAILTVGPLLLGASFSLTISSLDVVTAWSGEPSQALAIGLPQAVLKNGLAVIAQSVAFTLLFMLVPARPVRLIDAAIGGTFAGLGFQILRWGFDTFLTSGSTYATIYGAVAIVPIFLLWIYLSWTVIILGAVLSASFPDWWRGRDTLDEDTLSPGGTLSVAVAILAVMARHAAKGGTIAPETLADAVPVSARDTVMETLIGAGYVAQTLDERVSLARDLHVFTVGDLARDLGVSIGLDQAQDRSADFETVKQVAGEMPHLLFRLKQAEDEILSEPIAVVVATQLLRGDGPATADRPAGSGGNVTRLNTPVEFRRHRRAP